MVVTVDIPDEDYASMMRTIEALKYMGDDFELIEGNEDEVRKLIVDLRNVYIELVDIVFKDK